MGKNKNDDEVCVHAKPVVYAKNEEYRERAAQLAKKLQAQLAEDPSEIEEGTLRMICGADGLTLSDGKLSMQGDLTQMLSRIKPGKLSHEMLAKAAKIKGVGEHPTAIDATAGLGADSMILAAAGYEVQMYEYNPVIAALLEDALRRAKAVPELEEIAGRMNLVEGDSLEALKKLQTPPDLILLDPMFPARQKSALIKKKFQLLQQLEQPCTDEEALVRAALGAHPRKVVIKRPAKGAYLAGIKPDYSLEGKVIRYDCFVFSGKG